VRCANIRLDGYKRLAETRCNTDGRILAFPMTVSGCTHKTVIRRSGGPDGMAERYYRQAFWAVAHRGNSGGGRLGLWAYADEATAVKAARGVGAVRRV
jgi:hypothetical protein